MPDLSKLGVTMAEATSGVPAFQAMMADFAVCLAPAMREACKVVNETAFAMAKHGPAIDKAAAGAFASVAAALPRLPKSGADRG